MPRLTNYTIGSFGIDTNYTGNDLRVNGSIYANQFINTFNGYKRSISQLVLGIKPNSFCAFNGYARTTSL